MSTVSRRQKPACTRSSLGQFSAPASRRRCHHRGMWALWRGHRLQRGRKSSSTLVCRGGSCIAEGEGEEEGEGEDEPAAPPGPRTPVVCADVVDGCDDGNTGGGDGCSADCEFETDVCRLMVPASLAATAGVVGDPGSRCFSTVQAAIEGTSTGVAIYVGPGIYDTGSLFVSAESATRGVSRCAIQPSPSRRCPSVATSTSSLSTTSHRQ